MGVGFRQGLWFGEWEARARVEYLTLSLSAEVVGKYALYRWGRLDYAPFLGLGITLSSGARYFDPLTFTYAGVHGVAGIALTFKATDAIRLVARAQVPADWPLGTGGGARLRALAGGGVELFLVEDLTALALGEAGLDWIKEPLGVPVARFAWTATVGVGIRLF